jgi:hypothetical protein
MPQLFWTQRLHFGPASRMEHAMAYDAARQRVVLFGGIDAGANLGDTWLWDGTFWTQVADTGPAARSGHAMAYDSIRGQIVLFGGSTGATNVQDTWVWDGTAWTQVAETGPSVRKDHGMAFDEARGEVVLFGGADATELGDTWVWDGMAWTQKQTSGPSARRGHSISYDLNTQRLVLFGGASGSQILDDTWEWNGTVWTQIAEFGIPGALDAAAAFAGHGCVLFGGVASTAANQAGLDNTWEWDGRFWTEIQHFGPPGRTAHATAFDVVRQRLILFGGTRQSGPPLTATLLGDTWECPGRAPLLMSVTVSPTKVRLGGTVAVTVNLSEATTKDLPVRLALSIGPQPMDHLGFPSTITVLAGQAVASATATLSLQAPTVTYTVTASYGGIRRSTPLTVRTLRIYAVLPRPMGDETQTQEVHILNEGTTTVSLIGWRIANPEGQAWLLDSLGTIAPQMIGICARDGQPMPLPHAGGTILLINPAGETVDTRSYGPAAMGELIQFE